MKHTTPTREQFTQYQAAFDYFNAALFGGSLPPCMLNFSRHSKAFGFFVAEIWTRGEKATAHEISLNPDHLGQREAHVTLSTLVHEMVHHWQQCHGKPSRSGYHNRQWAAKMKEIGLFPSSTGEEGGEETGQRVSHYIIAGGGFDVAFRAMPKAILLPWRTSGCIGHKRKAKKQSKTPYVCPSCEIKVWGKPGLTNLQCGDCGEPFEEQ